MTKGEVFGIPDVLGILEYRTAVMTWRPSLSSSRHAAARVCIPQDRCQPWGLCPPTLILARSFCCALRKIGELLAEKTWLLRQPRQSRSQWQKKVLPKVMGTLHRVQVGLLLQMTTTKAQDRYFPLRVTC